MPKSAFGCQLGFLGAGISCTARDELDFRRWVGPLIDVLGPSILTRSSIAGANVSFRHSAGGSVGLRRYDLLLAASPSGLFEYIVRLEMKWAFAALLADGLTLVVWSWSLYPLSF